MLDQTHVVVIYFIGSFRSKISWFMGHDLLIDTDYQIGFPVDESKIV